MKILSLLFLVLSFVAAPAFALPPDLTTLTAAINLDTVGAALLAIAVVIVGFKVIKQGAMIVLRFLGWAK